MSESVTHIIRLKKHAGKRVPFGYPWVYSNEIETDAGWRQIPPGSLARLQAPDSSILGTVYVNPHSLIACRMLTRVRGEAIDRAFFTIRLRAALALREQLYAAPYYRLVHAEADGLPGLTLDRYGDVCVLQLATAGMERLRALLLEAVQDVLRPRTIILRNDVSQRELEGLEEQVEMIGEPLSGPVALQENGLTYLADVTGGQKTGWFYDQRDNRAHLAALAKGKRFLDLYCHSGGFALAAAKAGAARVTGVDSSSHALALAREAAEHNGLSERCDWQEMKAFEELEAYAREGTQFDVVSLDPPAFIKSRKDLQAGLKGYEKLIRLACPLVPAGGILALTSCSHHAERAMLLHAIAKGLGKAGRQGRILRIGGAACDHPIHPQLPESEYLKTVTLQLDA